MSDPQARYVGLPGSGRTLIPGSEAVGPVNPTDVIEVTIRLRSRAQAGDLDAAVAALGATPPEQRTYLTPEQFAAQYGADPAIITRIEQFAAAHNLKVVRADAGQRTVVLSGTVADLTAAFKVELIQYKSPLGAYRGRSGPVQVPEDIADSIEGIFGLDNRQQARPHIVMSARPAGGGGAVLTATKAQEARSFYPPTLGQFYNFPTNYDGTGQTIGILEFGGGFAQSDLQAYFGQLNLPVPQVDAVSVDGVSNEPGKDPDIDGEVLLDIEIASALAPGAKIVVYFAPFTEQGWVDVVTTAVHDTQHNPSVLSISWGYTEGQDIWTNQAIQAVNQAFQAAALMGVTVCAASGDDGSQDQLSDGQAHVDFPASSPYVLACGGTTLTFTGNDVTGEAVWNNGTRDGGGGATGGGISDVNALPSWQQGIVPPSVNPSHHVGRGVPDVAGDADSLTGYTIIVDGQELQGVGGTSAVSPLWSALIARLNQGLGKRVGYINPLLYSQLGKSGAFHDITDGNNDPTGGALGGYPAGAGWDACTGWGSPDGTKLLTALTNAPSSGGTTTPTNPSDPSVPTGTGSSGGTSDSASSGGISGVGVVVGVIVLIIVLVVIFLALPALGVNITH